MTTRLLLCYSGSELVKDIAYFINQVRALEAEPRFLEPVEKWRVKLWFNSNSYRPEQFSLVMTERGIKGMSWTWISKKGLGNISFTVDPRMPYHDKLEIIRKLLSFAKLSLKEQGSSSLVEIKMGGLRNHVIEALKDIIKHYQIVNRGYLMTLRQTFDIYKPPKHVKLHILKEINKDIAEKIADVFNSAFSMYDDFTEWDADDAYKYYSNLFRRRKGNAFIITALYRGEIVGFIESYVHKNLLGEIVGYHSLLAVKREHQNKGIGSTLLSNADRVLRKLGAKVTYLHSEPKASNLYLKLGFKIEDIYLSAKTLLSLLPEELGGLEVYNKTKCFSKA